MALSRKVYSTWLGRVSYADGLALQVRNFIFKLKYYIN